MRRGSWSGIKITIIFQTALTANLTANTSAPVALTAGFSWTGFDEYWKIWIDYDQDGTFEEPDELAFQQFLPKPADGTPSVTIHGSIAVPATALPGTTRMRVAMKRYNGLGPSPCESFAFGEVEDYGLNILPSFEPGDARTAASLPEADFFPNPAAGVVFFKMRGNPEAVSVKIFDRNGRLQQEAYFEKTGQDLLSIPLGSFPDGVYGLQIMTGNGRVISKKLVVIH